VTEPQDFTRDFVNLAAPQRGAAICSVSDEFFAPAKRMLSPEEPVFIADRYDAHGKWMDGWESRRKRSGGHDDCIVRICAGVIHGIEIDTSHFTGNYPPAASLEACKVKIEPNERTSWTVLLPRVELHGDSRYAFAVSNGERWTHVRLNIFPDGGIARLRIYGEPDQTQCLPDREQWVDLSSVAVGGRAIACNNQHFGLMENLLSNTDVANMGDGWETRRRREPGNDWVILKLGRTGRIGRVEVDTAFFRGNYPARCSLKGVHLKSDEPGSDANIVRESPDWAEILPQVSLGPDQMHVFESQLEAVGMVSHVRLDIYPDGGIGRLHLFGLPE